MTKIRRHIIIPDTQVRPDVPVNHLEAAGNYIADWKPDVVIHLGDHWDFPSLSTHKDVTFSKYQDDVEAGNLGLELLTKPSRRKRGYKPRFVLLRGNHDGYEVRSDGTSGRPGRFLMTNPKLIDKIKEGDLNDRKLGWEVQPFLDVVTIDGVMYSHYFYAPRTGRAYGGSSEYKLSKIHGSFTMGHVQGLSVGMKDLPGGRRIRGLVAGSFYQHYENYIGPQGNDHWRGILVKHEVKDGDYSLMEVSMDYLLREYL